LVGDKFLILNRGKLINTFAKSEITSEQLIKAMAGGAELDALSHELSSTKKAQ
jgi:simple sugar transport system ATP-binding protein